MEPDVIQARRAKRDFEVGSDFGPARWDSATPVFVERETTDGAIRPEISTAARVLWSEQYLYLRYECPFTELTVFTPAQGSGKRYDLTRQGVSLWDRDVVEAFIGTDNANPQRYAEFEIAPTNERLDLRCDLPDKDFAWQSGFESAVRVDHPQERWICETRIPMSAFDAKARSGARWRINLFRCDRANHALLAWQATLQPTFHVPIRFGVLEFVD